MNKRLEKHGIIVKKGALLNASITDSPLKQKGKANYEIVTDRKEEAVSEQEQVAVKVGKITLLDISLDDNGALAFIPKMVFEPG